MRRVRSERGTSSVMYREIIWNELSKSKKTTFLSGNVHYVYELLFLRNNNFFRSLSKVLIKSRLPYILNSFREFIPYSFTEDGLDIDGRLLEIFYVETYKGANYVLLYEKYESPLNKSKSLNQSGTLIYELPITYRIDHKRFKTRRLIYPINPPYGWTP